MATNGFNVLFVLCTTALLFTVCEGTHGIYDFEDKLDCMVNLECRERGNYGDYCCGNCEVRACCNSSSQQVNFVACLDKREETENSNNAESSKTLLIVVGSVAASLILVLGFQGLFKRFCSEKRTRRSNTVINPDENSHRLENGTNRISTSNIDRDLPSYRDLHLLKNSNRTVSPPNYYSLPGVMNSVKERSKRNHLNIPADPPSYSTVVSTNLNVPTVSEHVV